MACIATEYFAVDQRRDLDVDELEGIGRPARLRRLLCQGTLYSPSCSAGPEEFRAAAHKTEACEKLYTRLTCPQAERGAEQGYNRDMYVGQERADDYLNDRSSRGRFG